MSDRLINEEGAPKQGLLRWFSQLAETMDLTETDVLWAEVRRLSERLEKVEKLLQR